MAHLTLIFRFLIAICFYIMAYGVWYTRHISQLSMTQIYSFIALLIIYGTFRVYRAIKKSDDIFIEKS